MIEADENDDTKSVFLNQSTTLIAWLDTIRILFTKTRHHSLKRNITQTND